VGHEGALALDLLVQLPEPILELVDREPGTIQTTSRRKYTTAPTS
jgi:hypothetical protein